VVVLVCVQVYPSTVLFVMGQGIDAALVMLKFSSTRVAFPTLQENSSNWDWVKLAQGYLPMVPYQVSAPIGPKPIPHGAHWHMRRLLFGPVLHAIETGFQ
jgi:hypothetical protein